MADRERPQDGADDQRTRYRLPSVEDLENQPWLDNPGSEDYNRFAKSRIPRPVPSQSIEEPSGMSGGPLERAVTDSLIPMHGSPERTPVISLERSKTDTTRTPRYQHGKYQSYEQMLAEMESDDPFQGEPPPPKEVTRERTREKSFLRSSSRKRSPTKETSGEIRTRRKQTRSKPVKEEPEEKEDLEGTYTITHKNPVYKGIHVGSEPTVSNGTRKSRDAGGGKNKKSSKKDKKPRPVSASSTGTYTVGVDRSDSQSKLINDRREVRPSSVETTIPDGLMTTRSMAAKKRFDCRANTIKSSAEPDKDSIREYVKRNIKNRECNIYIRDARKEDTCQCGRGFDWHHEQNLPVAENKKEVWKSEKHTKQIDPLSYGTVRFVGFGKESQYGAPYVRVDSHCHDMEPIWNLLDKHWMMAPPKLLISVTGGAKRFFMKSRLMVSFKRGLVNLATTTGAWIISGGTHTGVMEFVGEAVKDYMLTTGGSQQKVVALGIATWGVVDNKDALTDYDNGDGMFPAEYNMDELSHKDAKGVSSLDPNHTHFILVDDGTERKFGAEIKFRVAFEQYISEKMETGVTRSQSVHVPVVQLVLEGGENSLKTAYETLKSNTPAVIIQGSGRAADFIAYAYRVSRSKESEDKSQFPPGFDEDLYNKAETLFDWTRETNPESKSKKVKVCVENVKKLLEYRRLITVFHLDDMDSTNDIDQAVLYALLKANKADAQTQLNLALAWNRCDIARQEIFTIENRAHWQRVDLYEAMFTALIQDRIDFVQLFLDCGVDMKRFLTTYNLRELYDDVIHDKYAGSSKDLLLHLLQETHASCYMNCCQNDPWSEDSPYLLQHVGSVIDRLMGDQQQDLYTGEKFVVHDKPGYLSARPDDGQLTKNGLSFTNKSYLGDTLSGTKGKSISRKRTRATIPPDFANPEKHLFLWAILLNRKQLALLFWKNGKDHIAAALVGCYLLKSLADEAEAEEETDLSNDLLTNANEFEEYAVGLINECYQRDKAMAHRLLSRELEEWGGTTLFSLADASECMEFMGHSCCQTRLNKIWKGNMALYTSTWKVIIGLFFPFILPAIKFSGVEFGNDTAAVEPSRSDSNPNRVAPEDEDEKIFSRAATRRGKRGPKEKLKRKLYTVQMCCCGIGESINIVQAIYYYHTAPLVKFCYHTISYLVYLALFSFFVMTDLHARDEPNFSGLSIYEYIVWAWAVTLVTEEIRQILRSRGTIRTKLREYFASTLNKFDLCAYLMLLSSIILRYTTSDTEKNFVWARMAYALTVMMFFIKFLYQFFVEKNIGPKVIMISKMLTDLVFFVLILLVFVFAYGVAVHSLMYPNSELSWSILKNVVYQPYWNIYGELFLEDIEGDVPGCSNNRSMYSDPGLDIPRCPEKSWLAMVLFVVYMVITNVLLLNLLIAMFSYTFEKVQENSEKVWRYYRHGLVYEYFDKPTLAPPMIIFTHIWRLCKYIYTMCCKKGQFQNTHFHQKLSTDDNNRLTAFVRSAMENYQILRHLEDQEHIDAKVTTTSNRIEKVIEDLDQIKESVISAESSLLSTSDLNEATSMASPNAIQVLPSARYDSKEEFMEMHQRISNLEVRLDNQQETMDRMVSILQEMLAGGRHTRGRYVSTQPQPHIEIQDFTDMGSTL